MILGVDTGLATCGWALLDERTCEVTDLGVVLTEHEQGTKVTLDRAKRALVQAHELALRARGVGTVVVEAMSFPPGGANAMVSIALSWGLALGVAAAQSTPPTVLTISPQRWQREVVPISGKRVNYPLVAAEIERLVRRHESAARKLDAIPVRHRNHALDAAALAVIGALRPRACMAVGLPKSRARRSKSLRILDESEPVWMPREGLPAGGRDECRHGERPCPYVHCKHHLWMIDSRDREGTMPDGRRKPSVLRARWLETPTPPCCELDITEALAARGEKLTIEQIASLLAVTADWASEVVQRALTSMKNAMEAA
jgi:hypothetical protein